MKKSKLTPLILVTIIIVGLLLTGCARERESEPTEPATTNDAGSVQSEQPSQPAQPLNPEPSTSTSPAGEPTTLAISTATPTPATSTGETTSEATATEATTEEIAAATATPVTSQSGTETTETSTTGDERVHVVQPGQNLFRIALQYGLEVDALARYNGITNPELIYVGQKIKIPGGGSANGTYTVQQGDTLLSIAVKFSTTTEALMAANGLSNADLIYVGQELNVP